MSIEIVSVRGKACLISAHLDFMTAGRSALPDREHYSRILSSPGGTIEESRFIVPIIPAYFICHYEMPSCNDARLFMTDSIVGPALLGEHFQVPFLLLTSSLSARV